MRSPLTSLEPDAEGPKALLRQDPLRLAERHCLGLRPPGLGEVPEPLPVAPAGDRDRAAEAEELQHPGELGAGAPPDGAVVGAGGIVLELPRGKRAASRELA